MTESRSILFRHLNPAAKIPPPKWFRNQDPLSCAGQTPEIAIARRSIFTR